MFSCVYTFIIKIKLFSNCEIKKWQSQLNLFERVLCSCRQNSENCSNKI